MITGTIVGLPILPRRQGNSTVNNFFIVKTTEDKFINIPLMTRDGFQITITIADALYKKYWNEINENSWLDSDEKYFFAISGEVRSSERLKENNITNLFIKVNRMELLEQELDINDFTMNAHVTSTQCEVDENLVWISANKSILNSKEKKNKPTYSLLYTNLDITKKDIVQGQVRIISKHNTLMLEDIYCKKYSACRELTESLALSPIEKLTDIIKVKR